MNNLTSPLGTPSMPSPSPSESSQNFPSISNFAGPNLLGSLVQAFETGIILSQSLRFWSRARRESVIVKACVVYVTIVCVLQTCFSIFESWDCLVLNFGNFVNAAGPRWPNKLQPIMNVMLAGPLQGLLIWRCWLLTGKPKPLLIFFVLAYLSSFAFPIVQVHEVFTVDFEAIFIGITTGLANGMKPPSYQLEPILVCLLVVPAVLDVTLTSILLHFFFRSRTSVSTRRFRKALDNLIIVIWEAALPPTICSIFAIAVYIQTNRTSVWFVFVLDILGPLYVIALFVTINGFHDVKRRDRNSDPEASSSSVTVTASTSNGGYNSGTEPQDILSTWAREASRSAAISFSGMWSSRSSNSNARRSAERELKSTSTSASGSSNLVEPMTASLGAEETKEEGSKTSTDVLSLRGKIALNATASKPGRAPSLTRSLRSSMESGGMVDA